MRDVPGKILFTQSQIRAAVRKIGFQIRAKLRQRNLTVVAVLNGSILFAADLIRELDFPVELGFLAASSYGAATQSSGHVRISCPGALRVKGRDVLLVDDILDSGLTLKTARQFLKKRGSRRIWTAVLIRKQTGRKACVRPDFVALRVPNRFVVGYGLDWGGRFRNLPHIAIFKDHSVAAPPDGSLCLTRTPSHPSVRAPE